MSNGAEQERGEFVRVRGASEHNLKHVDVDIPRNRLVVFTGVSGSGKTSLAFDTIFAEAQRRYLESVAPYARRLLQQVRPPHVVEIAGLPPAVALRQRPAAASSRSTVGTLTTTSSLLRILFSRAGSYPEGQPGLPAEAFSPNTAAGACRVCGGGGEAHDVTEELLVPDRSLSIRNGAIAAWPGAWQGHNLRRIVKRLGIDVDVPWRDLPAHERDWILFTDEQPRVLIRPEDKDGAGGRPYNGTFCSARRHVRHVLATATNETTRARMQTFVRTTPCRECHGTGLVAEALAVRFAGYSIAELNSVRIADLAAVLRAEESREPDGVVAKIASDLAARLEVLAGLGLGYLALGRRSTTLSPGEVQRLRIGSQLHSGLFGVVYVMDEPSAGLHPADVTRVYDVLTQLKAAGNSLFVVEHNLEVIRRADWVVDLGPGAGRAGGEILYSGPVAGMADVHRSATAAYLPVTVATARATRSPRGWLVLSGAHRNNLREVSVRFPIGVLTAVTGVSGSGKSTLAVGVLGDAARALRHTSSLLDGVVPGLVGATLTDDAACDRVVVVDQRPIGRTPRSNLATYTGLFDVIRRVFAATPAALRNGFGPSRFSFNVAGGRCEACRGEGWVAIELLFLPESRRVCTECAGRRYNEETLAVTYQGMSIADVLALSVDEAWDLLAAEPAARRGLRTLREVGLGYLTLGQPATEISGGEAQRIKLATELQRPRRGATLYLLDEPSSGLHPGDVATLLTQLQRLVDDGHTVVFVEHDLDSVLAADWVIDLGPGGGDTGGSVVATGTPETVARTSSGATARHLRRRHTRA